MRLVTLTDKQHEILTALVEQEATEAESNMQVLTALLYDDILDSLDRAKEVM